MVRQREPLSLLLVEDDDEIRELVAGILAEEGYTIDACPGLRVAEERVEERVYDLIITDLFPAASGDLLHGVSGLLASAHPTPVMIMTAHRLDTVATRQRGFREVLAKPFDLDELLLTVSACIETPLDAQQLGQAQVVERYFATLSRRDWDGFVALCTPNIIYTLPGTTTFSQVVAGKVALRAFTEQTFGAYPDAQFESVRVYATPHGLAARYQGRWHGPDGHEARQSGAVLFEFAGQQIARIGVRLNVERLETLARFQQTFGTGAEAT